MKFSKLFAFLCMMLLFAGSICAQTRSASDDGQTESVTEANPAIQPLTDESTISITEPVAPQTRGPSTFWIFFRMIVVLGFIVVCIYFVMRFVQKKFDITPDNDESFLRKVAGISLEPGRTVYVVTLLDKGYIIGSTQSSMDLIAEIDDKELVDAMNLNADKKAARTKARNFSEVLEMFMPSKGNAKESVYTGSTKNMSDFVKKQRNRIKEEE